MNRSSGSSGPKTILALDCRNKFIAVVDHRTQRRRRPAAFDSDHAAEAGFVLEHQTHAAGLYRFGVEDICQNLREFFFQSCCAFGSAFGCRVSGATLRQPWRSSIRYTTVAATGRPTLWAKAARNDETTSIRPSLACFTQGVKNAFSSSVVNKARRRPPQFLGETLPRVGRCRNRACSRATVARPTPSTTAVSFQLIPITAGRSIACAHLSCSALCAFAAATRARFIVIGSIRHGFDMPTI